MNVNIKAKHFMYPSNLLSISRIVLLIPIIILLSKQQYFWGIALSVVAALTDFFDGLLARKFNHVSDLGKFIDPLADKICLIVMVIFLMAVGQVPLWFMLILVIRDLYVFFGGIYLNRKKGIVVQSNMWGKFTSLFLSIYFVLCMIDFLVKMKIVLNIFIIISLLFIVVSTVTYTMNFFSIMKGTDGEKI